MPTASQIKINPHKELSKEIASGPRFLANQPSWHLGMMGDTTPLVLRPEYIVVLPQECLYSNQKVTFRCHKLVFAIALYLEGLKGHEDAILHQPFHPWTGQIAQ